MTNEKYEPTPEEIKKSEDMMTKGYASEQMQSALREKILEDGGVVISKRDNFTEFIRPGEDGKLHIYQQFAGSPAEQVDQIPEDVESLLRQTKANIEFNMMRLGAQKDGIEKMLLKLKE